MKTTKTLMLAGLTALSLGIGTAMAQEGGSFSPAGPDFWQTNNAAAPLAAAATATPTHSAIQSGSSDRTTGVDTGMQAYDQYNPYVGGN